MHLNVVWSEDCCASCRKEKYLSEKVFDFDRDQVLSISISLHVWWIRGNY